MNQTVYKMKNLLTISALFSVFVFSSCEDDVNDGGDNGSDSEGGVSTEQAQLEMEMLVDQASADITKLTESDGVQGAMDLLSLIEDYDFSGRLAEQENVRQRVHLLAQYFVYGPVQRVGEDEPFTFDDIKGRFEWNPVTESFDKSVSPFFIVLFPTEGSVENNAELKISKLELVTITENYDGYVDEYQLPSEVDGYLKIDDEEVIALTMSVDWSSDAFPEKADINLYVAPFTFVLGFDQSFESTSSLVTSVSLEDETIVGVDIDVEFETSAKEDPKSIEGFVQYYNLKVAGTVDVPTEEEEENGDINDFVNLELLLDDEKIGDIVFENDEAYVVYEDGTKELLESIIEPIIDDIDQFFEDFD